jgi:hypothetical protein
MNLAKELFRKRIEYYHILSRLFGPVKARMDTIKMMRTKRNRRDTDKVYRAKMWLRYYMRMDYKSHKEQKERNGWDRDPVFIQLNRAQFMLNFDKMYDMEKLFPNSAYAYYKKIVDDDERAKLRERMQQLNLIELVKMKLGGWMPAGYNPNDY